MASRILADLIVVIHLGWILFMLVGFFFTIAAFWKREWFDRWVFRTVHVFGIVYVSALAAMGRFCPLTVLENKLRLEQDSAEAYPGSFIVHYLENIVYPDVPPALVLVPTFVLAFLTLTVYILHPPRKIKMLLSDKL